MKNVFVLPLIGLALVACSELPTESRSPGSVHFDHGVQAGSGKAYHGYDAPELDWDGSTHMLCASWSDHAMNTDFYSFDFLIWNEANEEWEQVGQVRGDADGQDACLDVGALELEDGSYDVRVVGMAREGTGQSTTTHHTNPAEETITIGGTLRFKVELRSGSSTVSESLSFNRNAGTWNFSFVVSIWDGDSFEYVTDCANLPYADITTIAKWLNPNNAERTATPDITTPCENNGALGKALYKVGVQNANQSSVSNGVFDFEIDGSTNENTVSFSAS